MTIKTLKSLADDLAIKLTIENFKFLDRALIGYSEKEIRYVSVSLLNKFFGALIYRTLVEPKTLNQSALEHEQYVMKNMGDLKNQIQDCIANSFQEAMGAFTGQPVEYYCQIKVVPEPTSTTVN